MTHCHHTNACHPTQPPLLATDGRWCHLCCSKLGAMCKTSVSFSQASYPLKVNSRVWTARIRWYQNSRVPVQKPTKLLVQSSDCGPAHRAGIGSAIEAHPLGGHRSSVFGRLGSQVLIAKRHNYHAMQNNFNLNTPIVYVSRIGILMCSSLRTIHRPMGR